MAVKSLSQFADDMGRIGDTLPESANTIKKLLASAVLETEVRTTPVDTSQAKSRWQCGLNAAPDAVYGPFFPGSHGSTAGPSEAAAINTGRLVIQRARPGDVVFVSNNVPYINRLNDGYSKQAPANFIQQGVSAAIRLLAGLRLIK